MRQLFWLVGLGGKRLSPAALRFMRRAIASRRPAYVSAISIVETIYLIERSRVPFEASVCQIARIPVALQPA